MSARTFIYALLDPNTRAVRYIGKSDNPDKRLRRHLGQYEPKATHKSNWIKSLLEQGKSPLLLILEEVSSDEWVEAECRWIKVYQSNGADLTNSTKGGEGGKTLSRESLSVEERERRSKTAHNRMQKMWDDIKAERAAARQQEHDQWAKDSRDWADENGW